MKCKRNEESREVNTAGAEKRIEKWRRGEAERNREDMKRYKKYARARIRWHLNSFDTENWITKLSRWLRSRNMVVA